jgi:hypothetical protein
MSLDTQIFRNKLYEELKKSNLNYLDRYTFNTLLISTGSVIAGGSVLSAYHGGYWINDFDIYVNAENACRLKDGLVALGFNLENYSDYYITPAYDPSFFRRNNILGRIVLRKEGLRYEKVELDIIIVKNSIPVLDVVRNFDLTFCEIWYDGNNVNAVDPGGVLSKHGKLKPDYVNILLDTFNPFTLKRIRKYLERGFEIKYDTTVSEHTINLNREKTITSPENWAVYKMYNNIVKNISNSEFIDYDGSRIDIIFKIICECNIEEYSVVNLENMIKNCLGVDEERLKEFYMHILNKSEYVHYPREYKGYIETYFGISSEDMRVYRREQGDSEIEEDSEEEPEPEEPEPEQDYIFEEADVDERDMPNSTCSDLYTLEDDKNIVSHLEEEDTFLFINRGSTNDFDILCFEKSYIEGIISDKNNNWFYECTGRLIPGTNDRSMGQFINYPYIKVPINDSGLNGFIPLIQLRTLLINNNRIYYIYPMIENGTQKMITHTASWQNAYSSNPNWVSANHCQAGSSILVYTLKLCRNPERCIRSMV